MTEKVSHVSEPVHVAQVPLHFPCNATGGGVPWRNGDRDPENRQWPGSEIMCFSVERGRPAGRPLGLSVRGQFVVQPLRVRSAASSMYS